MSRIALITVFLIFGSFFMHKAFAQKKDPARHFNASPDMFYEAGDLNALKGDFTPFTLPTHKGYANQQVSYAKKQQLPPTAQVSNGPIFISNQLKCYQISGPKGKKGSIAWWDRNGDSKIQALKELRFVDPNGEADKVYVEEISCK